MTWAPCSSLYSTSFWQLIQWGHAGMSGSVEDSPKLFSIFLLPDILLILWIGLFEEKIPRVSFLQNRENSPHCSLFWVPSSETTHNSPLFIYEVWDVFVYEMFSIGLTPVLLFVFWDTELTFVKEITDFIVIALIDVDGTICLPSDWTYFVCLSIAFVGEVLHPRL